MESHTLPSNETDRIEEEGEEARASVVADAADISVGTKLGECHRWRAYLESVSAVYRELERERALGWKSKALDWWYQQRLQQPKQKQGVQQGDDDVVCSGVVAASDTSFACSDVEKLSERYCAHAARILSSAASEYFVVASRGRPQGQEDENGEGVDAPTFLDLGCAPGGVSKYLVTKLHWYGVGVSLPESRGGIAFDSSWLQSAGADSRYTLIPGSITEDDWHSAIKGRKFYFVNGGAVQDHGQREGAEVCHGDGAVPQQAVLPWFNFLVPQLRLAVEHVEENGIIMLVFGVPQCASLSILLSLVRPFVKGGVYIMETMHLIKSPVYVLLTGVRIAQEASRAAWAHLLERMTRDTAAFWLGETDDGMRLAKDGFTHHRRELEAVWEKAAAYLRRRRLHAERAMDAALGGRPKKRCRTHGKSHDCHGGGGDR